MNEHEICNYIAESSEKYYNHLKQHNKGVLKVKIKSVRQKDERKYFLTFEKPIREFDFITSVIFDGAEYLISDFDFSEITPFSADVEGKEELVRNFVTSRTIYLVTDFKKLVFRIMHRFRSSSQYFHLPKKESPLDMHWQNYENIDFSDSQTEAVTSIFSSPVSYVWGGAGSGKTRFVLAYAIMEYIRAGRPVLLAAPTNVALENALSAIIPIAAENGLDTKSIFRFGKPSAQFAKQFPDNCSSLHQSQQKIADELSAIDDYLKILRRFDVIHRVLDNIEIRRQLQNQIKALEEQAVKSTLFLRAEKQLHNEEAKQINRLITKYKRHQTSGLYQKLQQWNFISDKKLKEEIQKEKQAINLRKEKITELENNLRQLEGEILSYKNDSITREKENFRLLSGLPDLALDRLDERHLYPQCKEIQKKDTYYLQTVSKKYPLLKPENVDRIEKRRKRLEKLLADCEIKEQTKILVSGYTLDAYAATSYHSEDSRNNEMPLQFCHAFLDEACYASIPKAALMFFCGCPVTFLGDHLQLPPVAELNDEDLMEPENRPMFLWMQNGIYSIDLFFRSAYEMFQDYSFQTEQLPEYLAVSRLTETYRFGKSLAEILDRFVYNIGFHSVAPSDTQVKIINAPKKITGKNKRENESEALEIKQYLKMNTLDDYVILSPYVNQAKLMEFIMPDQRDHILTVHKSQGQEWDTVIISISDTYNMFFTDIHNKAAQAKQLLNTAISRAKKELMIVCDTAYWSTLDNQLISELIKIGKIIN